jgi:eukaryotic-like serine/threonine-protein kinase
METSTPDQSPDTAPDSAPTSFGDYVLLRQLASGGHGNFHLAKPPARLGIEAEHVVVKIVASIDDGASRRFVRELELFARITSPRLVTLYDAGQHEDRFFYSMEFCERGPLTAARQTMSRAEQLRAVADIACGAHDLHEAGIAHRDIRPGNALMRDDGTACLSDLGLARLGGGSLTSMAPMSSLGFVDPALITGTSAGRSTDIYSLGSLLHFALTGRSVHAGVTDAEPMMAVREVLRRPPVIDREALTPDEADLISSCVAHDPDERPATAAMVADQIEAAIAVLAPQPTTPAGQ